MDAGVGKFRALPVYLGTAPKEVVGIACFRTGRAFYIPKIHGRTVEWTGGRTKYFHSIKSFRVI